MSPARPAILRISPLRAAVLRRVAFDPMTRPRDARRAQVLLLAAQGVPNITIAEQLGVSATSTRRWRTSFANSGIASLADRAAGSGRPPSIPGLLLAEAAETIVRNEQFPSPASTRALATHLGVSEATIRRIRSDLRVGSTRGPISHPRLVEVAGALLTPELSALAVVLDPVSSRRFLRSRRGPHMDATCPGALVAAMTALDALRGAIAADDRAPAPGHPGGPGRTDAPGRAEVAAVNWEEFLGALFAQVPPGMHLHIVASGPFDLAAAASSLLAEQGRTGTDGPHPAPELLRIRRVPSAAWSHGRLILLARVLRSAPSHGAFTALPLLLGELDAALGRAERHRLHSSGEQWVLPRAALEARIRASRADFLDRTRQFSLPPS